MSVVYGPQIRSGSGPQGPYPPWPGAVGPGGPGGAGGYGGGSERPGSPARRVRRHLLAVVAVAVAAAGAGAFWGLKATGTAPGSTVLTTAQIAAQVSPGLVDIVSTLGYQQAQAAGTGVVLTPTGEVLTNNHVIRGATSITVTDVGNGRSYLARVVGYDQSHDIAVLALRGASGLRTVTLAGSSGTAVGQKVVALGNAGGRGGAPSVVTGRITSLRASVTASDASAGTTEHLTGLISHNAAIQPGDSGGPLVSTTGQVVGINTAASASFGFRSGQTRAFAIPVSDAVLIARQIEAGATSSTVHTGATGFLGVQILPADGAAAQGVPAGAGAAVAGIIPGSPAGRAGLAAGDVIVSAAGHPVTSPSALQAALEPRHPGDSITVSWTDQAGQAHSATIVLAAGPPA